MNGDTGQIYTQNGRRKVQHDSSADFFPWFDVSQSKSKVKEQFSKPEVLLGLAVGVGVGVGIGVSILILFLFGRRNK